MAQIQEYEPQVASPEPVGGVSPNIELSGAVGKGFENLGSAAGALSERIYNRQAQEDTANVYSDMANARADWTNKVNEQIQNGTLDTDQLMQDFDNQTTDMGSDISTAQGRNYFERQQARLRGTILRTATVGQAQIAARHAQGQWQAGVTQTSSALMSDPSQFEDAVHAGVDSIDELINNGGLPDKMRDKAIQQMSAEYSKGAIRGFAAQGPDGPDVARQLVEGGHFDQFLDADQKKQMLSEIDMRERANDAESARSDRAVEKAQKAAQEAWGAENFQKLVDGRLKPADVVDAVQKKILTPEKGEHYINAIETTSKKDTQTNPRFYNQLVSRIADPNNPNPISSPDELIPLVAQGKLAADGPHSLKTLKGLFNQTPDGQALAQGQKALFDYAKSSIRFKDLMGGGYDARGEQKLAQFYADFAHAKENLPKGAAPKDLVDPNSPYYFGNNIQTTYATPLMQRGPVQAQDRTNKALGIPTPANPNAQPVKDARKPGESPADYLKRIGR